MIGDILSATRTGVEVFLRILSSTFAWEAAVIKGFSDKIGVDRNINDSNEPVLGQRRNGVLGGEAAGFVLHGRKFARLLWSLSGDWKGSGFHLEADDRSLCVSTTR